MLGIHQHRGITIVRGGTNIHPWQQRSKNNLEGSSGEKGEDQEATHTHIRISASYVTQRDVLYRLLSHALIATRDL